MNKMTGGDGAGAGGEGPNNYTITMQGAAAVMDRPSVAFSQCFQID